MKDLKMTNEVEIIDYKSMSEAQKIAEIDRLPDCLTKLRTYARMAKGPIVEIGSYIGGSSCAMADAVRDSDIPYFIIEAGGSYPNQPYLPTDDILADLKNNLNTWSLFSRVKIIESQATAAAWQLKEMLLGEKIGMLFIDADGNSAAIIQCLLPLLADGCLLILDDYSDPDKGIPVRSFIKNALENGSVTFHTFDDDNESTWFGQISNSPGSLPKTNGFRCESGNCFIAFPPIFCEPSSTEFPNRSALRLFEDGKEIGPSNALHDDIRKIGKGRFSYWNGNLFFSTSDNSNPNESNRIYEIRHGNEAFKLN